MVKTHQEDPNYILKTVSACSILEFVFSLLHRVWPLASSWWVRLGRKCFPGFSEFKKKKDLGRNILTLAPSYPSGACFVQDVSLFSFALFQSLMCWQPLALFTWSDGPGSPVPCRGESVPFVHIVGRLKGIKWRVITCLLGESLCCWHIAQHSGGFASGWNAWQASSLSLSTNLVHFPPVAAFCRRLFLMHIDWLVENASEG